MVKSQLIECVANKQQMFSPEEIELGINHLLEYMGTQISAGQRIEIRNFGSFCLHYREPRKAHNPKTGEEVITSKRYVPHFKAGKELKLRINRPNQPPIKQHDENI